MENAQLVGLSRQVTLQRHMDVIANNLANITTNGYKTQSLLFEDIKLPRAEVDAFQRPDRPVDFVIDDANLYDLQPGQMLATGNPTDIAIEGAGWFVVQTPQGERFTRNGSFALDANGQLVTRDGNPVLTDGGPITFQQNETAITVSSDGSISTNQGARGRLRVVEFAKQGDLKKIGDTLFEGANPQPSTFPRVMQGQIEKSNVRSVVELSRMIQVSREYQSVANWLAATDDLRRSAIEKLAQVS
jgi:flagellar basal-body rod protein FlgF